MASPMRELWQSGIRAGKDALFLHWILLHSMQCVQKMVRAERSVVNTTSADARHTALSLALLVRAEPIAKYLVANGADTQSKQVQSLCAHMYDGQHTAAQLARWARERATKAGKEPCAEQP